MTSACPPFAAEERERLPELPRTCGRTICSRRGDHSLEALNIHLVALCQHQSVSRWSGLNPVGSEPLPKGRDVTVPGSTSRGIGGNVPRVRFPPLTHHPPQLSALGVTPKIAAGVALRLPAEAFGGPEA